MKFLVVLGSGGHTKEMTRLVDLLGPRYEYSYVMVADDDLSPGKIRFPGAVYRVLRPRWKTTILPAVVIRCLFCTCQSLAILARARPQVVISSGPGSAVPVSLLAKLLRIKVVYIETGSRVFSLSVSGRILYHFADMFFVQWPELKSLYPRALYAGRLL